MGPPTRLPLANVDDVLGQAQGDDPQDYISVRHMKLQGGRLIATVFHHMWNRHGECRRPGVQEREALMGFPIDYTRQCVPKMEQKGDHYEDIRMSMIGNSWHVGVVSWLIGQLAHSLGLGGLTAVQDIINATTPGRARDFCSMLLPRERLIGKNQ